MLRRTASRPARALVAFAPFLASGCTAIADLGQYRTDLGCDLAMDFRGFASHAPAPGFPGQPLELRVVPPEGSATDGGLRTRAATLVLEPTPAIDFDLRLPAAVPSHQDSVDFYVDRDGNGVFDPVDPSSGVRVDHAWTEPRICSNPPRTFTHSLQFHDFPESVGADDDFVLVLTGFHAAGHRVETLVQTLDPATSLLRTTGFHYLGTAASDDPTVRIPQALDRGVAYRIELFVDRDGDGAVTDLPSNDGTTDEAYVFELEPGVSLPATGPVTLAPSGAGSLEHSGAVHVILH